MTDPQQFPDVGTNSFQQRQLEYGQSIQIPVETLQVFVRLSKQQTIALHRVVVLPAGAYVLKHNIFAPLLMHDQSLWNSRNALTVACLRLPSGIVQQSADVSLDETDVLRTVTCGLSLQIVEPIQFTAAFCRSQFQLTESFFSSQVQAVIQQEFRTLSNQLDALQFVRTPKSYTKFLQALQEAVNSRLLRLGVMVVRLRLLKADFTSIVLPEIKAALQNLFRLSDAFDFASPVLPDVRALCRGCSSRLSAGKQYCAACGMSVYIQDLCNACGAENAFLSPFCNYCGADAVPPSATVCSVT